MHSICTIEKQTSYEIIDIESGNIEKNGRKTARPICRVAKCSLIETEIEWEKKRKTFLAENQSGDESQAKVPDTYTELIKTYYLKEWPSVMSSGPSLKP